MTPPCPDPVVERVVARLRSRSAVGVRKYNSTLASSSLSNLAFLRHLLEELLDAANYTQTLIDREGDPAVPSDAPAPTPKTGYPPGW